MTKTNTFWSLILLVCLPLLIRCSTTNEAPKDKSPNIIFILADDLGYGELGSYGQEYFQTPNIDKLAEQGMRFTDFYAGNAVCGPSRCSLITGRQPGRASMRGNAALVGQESIVIDRAGISKNDSTIGEIMQNNGYKTALCGKWHLEYYDDSLATWPKYRGFDYAVRERWNKGIIADRLAYEQKTGVIYDDNYPYEVWENGQKITLEDNKTGTQAQLIDDVMVEKGLNFIKDNKNDPFFIFFSLKIPHTPETFAADSGLWMDRQWPECERIHALRIRHLDQLIGRIVTSVDDMGLGENTLIVFTSDNGGHNEGAYGNPKVDPCKHDHHFFKSNGVLKGHKRDPYEGGMRVPMLARWTGKINPGSISDHIGAFWDFMATFSDVAEKEPLTYDHDGVSILPTLLGKKQEVHSHLYWELLNFEKLKDTTTYGFTQAVRMGNWKAVKRGIKNDVELYDLSNDISEEINLSEKYQEVAHKMDSLMSSSRVESEFYPLGGTINLNQSKQVRWAEGKI